MTKKIFTSCIIVTVTVLIASIVIIFGVLYDYFSLEQDKQLEAQLNLACRAVSAVGEEYFEEFNDNTFRFTWIDADGTVIIDTQAPGEKSENYSEREEVKEAFETGRGESSRFSETMLEKTTYIAEKLSDGTVLRASVTSYSIITLVLGMMQPISVVIVLAVILAALMAHKMSKKIVKPLNSLDLKNPLSNDVYDELAPLLNHIEQQHKKIDDQLSELKSDKEEFTAITENLNEGLIVLDSSGTVLSINPAAKKIFNTDEYCIGQNFLVVDRSLDTAKIIDEAIKNGHSEACIKRSGRVYRLSAGKTRALKNDANVVVLIFDISEMVFAEKNRREFTANVSHELKTPLQSIMGSAELIENGLVKKEDMAEFISRIRTESARLLTLIEDIIRLSQLDEKQEIPFEQVDLFNIVKEVNDELSHNIKKKDIDVHIDGKKTILQGVGRLVYEIVFNLFDNAVKYNVDGGSIKINVYQDKDNAVFEISDTGIGIPAEEQDHVFERFYRVDKSRSKAIGGTGLGLSIVKHAVNYLSAKIDLESEVGKGTKIKVTFPAGKKRYI